MANFKKASVVVLANATGTQTINSAASGVRLQWTEVADQTNYGPTLNHMNNNIFTAPYDGFYMVNLSLYYGTTVALTAGFVSAVKNSSLAGGIILLQGATEAGAVQNASRMFKLTAGETLQFYVAQTSGSAQTPDVTNTVLSIVRVGNAS